jgi:hypothetical protein
VIDYLIKQEFVAPLTGVCKPRSRLFRRIVACSPQQHNELADLAAIFPH